MRIILIIVVLVAACRDAPSGSISATAYGEDFIEQGIPEAVFGDGWSVRFDKFVVSIGQPAVEGRSAVGDAGMYVVDLAQPSGGEGYELATFAAPAGSYDRFGYRIAPARDALAINASAGDAAALAAAGHSIWLRGSATNGAVTKTFDWGFALSLAYSHCAVAARLGDEDVTMQATIHADHFFYDDAVSDEPGVAFQLIADSDANGDGAVTLGELAGKDIRGETRYQVGSKRDPDGDPIINMAQYLELQATTLGHVNGEGHCAELVVAP